MHCIEQKITEGTGSNMKIKKIMSMMLLFCFSLFANEKLVLGVNPYKSTTELQKIYAELVEYLEKALDREIVFVVSKDYNQLLTLIEQGSVDIASISPKLFATSRQKEIPTEYLATLQVTDDQNNARSAYHGLIVTHKESSIYTMADLKKKSFGFTDPDSTSGYFYPRLMMKQNGIDPKNELGKVYMLKKHSKIIDAILEKSIDAGALYDGAYIILPKEKQEQIRILATSKEIPYDAMIASNKLDKAFVAKIRTLLLNFHATKHFPSSIAGFEEKPLSLYDQLNHLE